MVRPLDPLTPDELTAAVALARTDPRFGREPRFAWVALAEPDKATLQAGGTVPRRAEVVVVDRATGLTHDGVVDLDAGVVQRAAALAGLHAPTLYEEWTGAVRVLADERVQAALARRGIADPATLHVEPWGVGFGEPGWDLERRRIGRVTFFVRDDPADTAWARPVEGLVVLADRVSAEVIEVIDLEDPPEIPADPWRITDPGRAARTDVAPLVITQPDGPGFTVDGSVITWQRWRFQVSLHPIEGIVLRDVTYDDPATGRRRRVAWRLSVPEMVVPYGDPSPMHEWRHVFDAGEVGLGRNATSLTLGCDCLGEIRYLDGHVVEADGTVRTIPNAICLHEEDDGVLWRHYDARTDTTEVRRRRRFVVSSWTNLGNYDYGFYWRFQQDGSIEPEVRLTGVALASAIEPGTTPEHGVVVAPGLSAPHHQHLFSFRLDLDVDGAANTVEEVDVVAPAIDEHNRRGTAMVAQHTTIGRESEGRRMNDPLRSRAWYVRNRGVTNALGEPVGYKLVPGGGAVLLADPSSPVAARAGFARHHLWVTAYDPGQLRPAGHYPNQHPGGAGLPAWSAADRPLEDTDVVLWYTIGTTHVARPEDWPVMPVARASFVLEPVGFFDRNPALDVPPQALVNPGGHCH
jgi:primary-amine oxidase